MFRSIFASYGDACHELFCVWGFLCIKDVGRIGNKITAVHNLHNKQVFYSRVTLQLLLRQTMWLQPPFFSIVTWHFGHSYNNRKTITKMSLTLWYKISMYSFGCHQQCPIKDRTAVLKKKQTLVFADIQFDVSLSSLHFFIHFLSH